MPPTVLHELTGRRSRFQREGKPVGFLGDVPWVANLFGVAAFSLYLWWGFHEFGASAGVSQIGIFGLVLLLAFGVLSPVAARRKLANRRNQEMEWRDRGELWLLDYRWDREKVSSDFTGLGERWLRPWARALAPAFMVGLLSSLFSSRGSSALLLLGYAGAVLLSTLPNDPLRRLRFGDSHLFLSRFPYFLGEELPLRLVGLDHLRGASSVEVTLRCIQEGFFGPGQGRTFSVLREESRLLDPRSITLDEAPVAGTVRIGEWTEDRSALRFEFLLPADPAFETQLTGRLPRYWELEITAERPGLDYHGRFLLPVYHRSGEANPVAV